MDHLSPFLFGLESHQKAHNVEWEIRRESLMLRVLVTGVRKLWAWLFGNRGFYNNNIGMSLATSAKARSWYPTFQAGPGAPTRIDKIGLT